MHPRGLHGIQPRAFTWQPTGDGAHATPRLFDLAVVRPQPSLHLLARVPRGLVPHQPPDGLSQGTPAGAAPGPKLGREATDRVPRCKPQPDLLRSRGGRPPPQPLAGQRLGLALGWGRSVVHQAPGLRSRCPGVQGGLRQATPPDLIAKAEHPGGMGRRQTNQAGTRCFFRVSAGSGLVIQRLARRHLTPSRRSASRIASPLTSRGTMPSAYATSAARGKVQRLVGLPEVRGL